MRLLSGCDYDVTDDSEIGQECRSRELQGFYIRGFSVEEFPMNGIQTRWVDGFEFVRNASVNNLNNGIYPTLSANGLVRNNESYGSLDTAMWVAGSENVRVIGNELYGSVIGFEITVSNEVAVKQNEIYDNTVGVGLFHPNGAGNPPLPVMANWLIEQNDIYDNNRPEHGTSRDLPEHSAAGDRGTAAWRQRPCDREEQRRGQRFRRDRGAGVVHGHSAGDARELW